MQQYHEKRNRVENKMKLSLNSSFQMLMMMMLTMSISKTTTNFARKIHTHLLYKKKFAVLKYFFLLFLHWFKKEIN